MIGEWRTFTYIETRTFHHFIPRIFRDKDKVWNREYFVILRLWYRYILFTNYVKKTPVLKKDKHNFDIPEGK